MSPRDGTSSRSCERAVPGHVDDAFEQSIARLSLHLATRPPPSPLEELPPVPRRSAGRHYLIAFALLGLSAAVYWYPQVVDQTTSSVPEATVAEAAPSPPPPALEATITVAEAPGAAESVMAVAVAPVEASPVTTALTQPAMPTVDQFPRSSAEIMDIQRRLASSGIDPGPIDGIAGPRTLAAIQRYHALRTMPPRQQANAR